MGWISGRADILRINICWSPVLSIGWEKCSWRLYFIQGPSGLCITDDYHFNSSSQDTVQSIEKDTAFREYGFCYIMGTNCIMAHKHAGCHIRLGHVTEDNMQKEADTRGLLLALDMLLMHFINTNSWFNILCMCVWYVCLPHLHFGVASITSNWVLTKSLPPCKSWP